uniref:Apple domain-containing protein n=1 Tax=Acrobeloides nanus TaxID=290746 RepID=A0A914E516_9BILA
MEIFKISIFLGCIFGFTEKVFGQAGCTTSYNNKAIYGNDLAQVAGSSSSCCLACQQKSGCVAYTWNSINGGTCWLKSATAPIYVANGQFTVMMSPTPARTYSLNISYDSTNFFDLFTFFTHNYNEGYTNYVDKATAMSSGIAKYQGQKV